MNTENQNQNKGQNSSQNQNQTENNWNRVKDQYREKYPQLSQEDTKYRDGEFEQMTERIGKKTNRNSQDVQNEIKNWNHDKHDDDSNNYRKERYQNS